MSKFFDWNRKKSRAMMNWFKHTHYNIFEDYVKTVAHFFTQTADKNNIILDIGGGKSCAFSQEDFRKNAHIVAMDISAEELALNTSVDEKIQADVTKSIPMGSVKPGLITSQCVMEHLQDNRAFIELSARQIMAGGYFIAVIPNKFALFSIINQILGNDLGKKVLTFVGKKSAYNGFKAYYNKTYHSALKKLLQENHYQIVHEAYSYSSSAYFDFFIPLCFLSLVWEWIMRCLHVKNLCSYLLIVAKKRPESLVGSAASPIEFTVKQPIL